MFGCRFLSNITAKIWPMNCMRILVVIKASMTIPSEKKLHAIEMIPMTISET